MYFKKSAIFFGMLLCFSAEATNFLATPQMLEMARDGNQVKLAFVLGYIQGVLDNMTTEDKICLELAVGKTREQIASEILSRTKVDYARRQENINSVVRLLGREAPFFNAGMDVLISARQLYPCR